MPNQIYHSSPTPPIIYHQGKEYIGGMAIGGGVTYPDSLFWDFTKTLEEQNFKDIPEEYYSPLFITAPNIDAYTNFSAVVSENGILIDDAYHSIRIILIPYRDDMARVYEIEFGEIDFKPFSGHKSIFSFGYSNTNAGLIYRSNGYLSIWKDSWTTSDITDADYFSNSILKVKLRIDGKWDIYKNDSFVFSSDNVVTGPNMNVQNVHIGCATGNNSLKNMYVKNVKCYYEEETT